MDPNFNQSSSQNSNFYDSQNQPNFFHSFIPPNFQFIQNPQNTPNLPFNQNSQNQLNFQFTQNSQNQPYPYFPPFMQNYSHPYFSQNMHINSQNLDVGSRANNSKSAETGSISTSQIPSFSTEPGVGNINLTQEPNEEIGEKRQPWNMEDDKRLAKAWLTISCDPIVGNGQSERQLWKRIAEYYNKHRRSSVERKASHCKNHWYWMMPTVNAFNQIYNKLLDEHHSGWSDDQLKEHA